MYAGPVDTMSNGDAEDLQELPLPALLQLGQDILKQLESQSASDPATQRLVERGGAVLRRAAAAADSLALFSANEDRDDLATADIKYLLLPFYLAEVLTHTHAVDPSIRLAALTAAWDQYKSFLHRCRQYDLLSPPAAALAEAAFQHGDSDGHGGGSRGAMDAATLRQHKIEKFKREKAIQARLEALGQQRRQLRLEEDAAAAAGGGDAEEVEREAWLLQADLAALQAAERIGTLLQELQFLRHAASMPAEQRERERQQRAQARAGPPPDMLRQLAAAAGSLSSGTPQRERLAAGVFRPSHVLPTMSVEQFGELEYRRVLEQQQREAAAKERQQRAQAERHPDDAEEEEVQKQRAWDEFKDDNPRGWGNSKLRPCS